MNVSCLAVLGVRNEELYIETTIRDLVDQGIDVVVLDNGSTDATRTICNKFLGKGLLQIEDLPWHGCFNLSEQLETKRKIIQSMPHEWIIHIDADEWFQSPVDGESLLEGISRVSHEGYNVINFDEFIFLPEPGRDYSNTNFRELILNYYYFEPKPLRGMRAWKNDGTVTGMTRGGHVVSGEVNIAPEAFIHRHYITLSQQHINDKYLGKRFAIEDLKKHWHTNRYELRKKDLVLPDPSELKSLSDWKSKDFDRRDRKKQHYWLWKKSYLHDIVKYSKLLLNRYLK